MNILNKMQLMYSAIVESSSKDKPLEYKDSETTIKHIGFERNQQAIDPNCALIRITKARKFGKTGSVKTYYDPYTGILFQKVTSKSGYTGKRLKKSAKKRTS